MALPVLLRGEVVAAEPLDAAAGGGPRAKSKTLTFVMQHQQQEKWCWAATAVSVAVYYLPSTGWTQCKLAAAELQRDDCCGSGASGPCNQPWHLHTSLGRLGRLKDWDRTASSFRTLMSEIDAGNPVCARTRWGDGSAHFLALVGYIEAGGEVAEDFVVVADPLYGPAQYTYAEFRDAYRDDGTWTRTYRCK
jgi:hypothetical protein